MFGAKLDLLVHACDVNGCIVFTQSNQNKVKLSYTYSFGGTFILLFFMNSLVLFIVLVLFTSTFRCLCLSGCLFLSLQTVSISVLVVGIFSGSAGCITMPVGVF